MNIRTPTRPSIAYLSILAIHHNIFVVGDDAQSIYKFRGSDITNILNFEKDYPEGVGY